MATFSQSSPRPSSLDVRHRWPVFLLGVPFLASIAFAYIWFNTDIGRSRHSSLVTRHSQGIFLTAKTNLPGYTFIPEPVSEDVKKILGTTNILNGSFVRNSGSEDRRQKTEDRDPRSEASQQIALLSSVVRPPSSGHPDRITVFLATWTKNDKRGLEAIQHTPDICWVGSGWKPIDIGQPGRLLVTFPITDRYLPAPALDPRLSTFDSPVSFTLRAFESPDSKSTEIAAWCTFVSGQAILEPEIQKDASRSGGSVLQREHETRKTIASQFFRVLMDRLPSSRMRQSRVRQFARFSTPIVADVDSAIASLSDFSSSWLRAVRVKTEL